MGLSGFLYVAIVVGWAVYLVPFALKRYDEAARQRSVDRFSSAMRVLGRRDAAPGAPGTAPSTGPGAPAPGRGPAAPRPADREHARTAARRRRRVLLTLLLAVAGTATACGLQALPWWSVAVPGGLVVLWMLLCRLQARGERRARERRRSRGVVAPPAAAVQSPEPAAVSAGLLDVHAPAVEPVPQAAPEVAPDDEPTIELSRDDLRAGAPSPAGGSLWDPVPVTLPTYVHKPRAPRTIRTIDLGAVAVQNAGHVTDATPDEAASRTAQAGDQTGGERDDEGTQERVTRRAVGE